MPGRAISTAFCNDCGSPVPYLSGNKQALIVPAGSLDDNPNIAPQDHIFWAERAHWYDGVDTCSKFNGFVE